VNDPFSSENTRKGESETFEVVLAGKGGREGDNFFRVSFDDSDKVRNRGGDAVVSGSFTFDDFIGVFTSFFESPDELVGGKFGEREKRFAADGGGANGCKGGVTVFA